MYITQSKSANWKVRRGLWIQPQDKYGDERMKQWNGDEDDWTLFLHKEYYGRLPMTQTFKTNKKKWDWLIGVGGWVVGRAWCVIAPASSRRLLVVEFKGAVFLYATLRIHENVSPGRFSEANLSAKYFLTGPLPFSRMLLTHSLVPSCPRRIWISKWDGEGMQGKSAQFTSRAATDV